MAIVKQRDSNLELLRIVAMSMIVIYHIFVHGISPVYVGSHSILTVWYVPFIFGVNLFILISGYYGIRLSWKSFLSLMWIIVFYSKHPIKYPFSLLYFHCTFAFAILHELLTYFHYDTRTI